MADKKRGKRRKEDIGDPSAAEVDKPSKEEYEVAKWLRKNVPTKKTKFLNHNVEYFTGSKAVTALLTSKWSQPPKGGGDPLFPSREACVTFLDTMLRHKFYHRAKKVAVSEDLLKGKKKKDSKKDDKEKKEEKKDKKAEEKKEEDLAESSHAEGKAVEGNEDDSERKKKKKKVRLEMHMDQFFADNLDAYVWIYDPIPMHYWLFGALVVLAAIGICLFPLWPPGVRMVVYYLSVLAAGFLVFIIILTVLRFIIFCLIWLLTLGKHHLWLFPNLTEDVGFFASFWPLYQYEYKDGSTPPPKKKKKKDKLSDNEDEGETEKKIVETHQEELDSNLLKNEEESVERRDGSGSESESSSQQSQTGKDFEMVDKNEIELQN